MIFDDNTLDVGTKYYSNEILDWSPELQRYLVSSPLFGQPKWMSKESVEEAHANYLMQGVEVREAKPGNGYNTRFFRSRY